MLLALGITLLSLIITRYGKGVTIPVIEGFVQAMRRLDVRNEPCAILDENCLSSPLSLAQFYQKIRSDESLLEHISHLHKPRLKNWLTRLGWYGRFTAKLPASQKISLALLLRYVKRVGKLGRPNTEKLSIDGGSKNDGSLAKLASPDSIETIHSEYKKLRKPYMMAHYILSNTFEGNNDTRRTDISISMLKYVSPERLIYILAQTKSVPPLRFPNEASIRPLNSNMNNLERTLLNDPDGFGLEFFANFTSPNRKCIDGTLENFKNIKDPEYEKIFGNENFNEERFCTFSPTLQQYILKTGSIEAALQPFLEYSPLVAFANAHIAQVYNAAKRLDKALHLKLLGEMPIVTPATSTAELWDWYEKYVTAAHGRMNNNSPNEWLELCTGLENGTITGLKDIRPNLTSSMKSLTDCKLTLFGMSSIMPTSQKIAFLGNLVGWEKEKLFQDYDEKSKAALLALGQGHLPLVFDDTSSDLFLKARLLLRFPIEISNVVISKSWAEILDRLSAKLTLKTVGVEDDNTSRYILARAINECSLVLKDEMRNFLRSLRIGVDLFACPVKSNLQNVKINPQIDFASSKPEAYLSLFFELTGVPVTEPGDFSSSFPGVSRIETSIKQSVSTDTTGNDELIALAIITAVNTGGNHSKVLPWPKGSIKTPEHFYDSLWKFLCNKEPLGEEARLKFKDISIQLIWSFISAEKLESLTCPDYKQLIDLAASDKRNNSTDDYMETVKKIFNQEESKLDNNVDDGRWQRLAARLKKYSPLYLRLALEPPPTLNDSKIERNVFIFQPATQKLLTVPIFGRVLKAILCSDNNVAKHEYLNLPVIDFSKKGYQILIEFINKYFLELNPRQAIELIPAPKGYYDFFACHVNLERFIMACHSPAQCAAQLTIYGEPLILYNTDIMTLRKRLIESIFNPPTSISRNDLSTRMFTLGAGKAHRQLSNETLPLSLPNQQSCHPTST